MSTNLERLQKVIAQSGLTSRRKAEELIISGRVKVNSKVVTTLGTKVSPKDEIAVDDVPIEKEKFVYYLLYKPRGFISAVEDDRGRETVIDLMEDVQQRIFPIGRLDYTTSGILLLTNDGDFAHLLMHPKHEIEKVYVAKVKGIPSKSSLNRMIKGVTDNGELLKAMNYKVISVDKKKETMILEITLHEGKNRHIRRMMDQIGHPILKLKRERYGSLTLKQLQPGRFRPLTRQEVHQLTMQASKNVKQ
ncbi:pseudouridine synthase [Pseudogracilibacillus sp. SE30717A]|uniref:pseudouridine synthase n=1 Tax=Pseudogracilibacillus sp. SE30717A TaxID=3098293 RepID=UPI00300DEE6F